MSKRIISLLMVMSIAVSVMGCGKENKVSKANETQQKAITFDEKYESLSGEWSEDVTYEVAEEKFKGLLKKVEEQTKGYGLEYKKENVVKDNEGVTESEQFIYLDNEKAEKNRLESLYFGFKTYGEKIDAGQIQLKVSLKFDGEGAIKDDKFEFGDTSLAKYSSLITGKETRDYKEINNKIMEIIKSEKGEGVVESEVDGLYEEFTVSKNCIVYRLETKKYDFKKAREENPSNVQ
ncbi:MAG: hypothetical protein ACRC2K_02810 [Clostridium sp.]